LLQEARDVVPLDFLYFLGRWRRPHSVL